MELAIRKAWSIPLDALEAASMSEPTQPSDATPNFRRFADPFLSLALIFATLAGTLLPLEVAISLRSFATVEAAPQVAMVSLARSVGPAMSLIAATLALVVWSHGLDVDTVLRARRRTVLGAMFTAIVAAPITTLLAMFASAIVFHFAYHLSWSVIAGATSTIRGSDLASLGITLAVDAVIATIALTLGLPALARSTWTLRKKVIVSGIAAIVIRSLVDAALAFVLGAR